MFNFKTLTDEQILLLLYALVGLLAFCAIVIGIVVIQGWVARQKDALSLLSQTKENLEKLEQILSRQAPFDIKSLYVLSVVPSIRSMFLDILRGFEFFASLRGYQVRRLLSFSASPSNRIEILRLEKQGWV